MSLQAYQGPGCPADVDNHPLLVSQASGDRAYLRVGTMIDGKVAPVGGGAPAAQALRNYPQVRKELYVCPNIGSLRK